MSDSARHNLYAIAEATYGTTPAKPSMFHIRHTACSLGLSKGSTVSAELRADRQISDFRHGNRQIGGDIGIELSYGTFDTLLAAVLLGAWDADVLKSGVTRQSFSLLRHFSDLSGAANPYHLFKGVEFNRLSLTMTPGGIVTAQLGAIGQDMAVAAATPTDAVLGDPTTAPVFDSFTGTLTEGGGASAVVTELTLTLENGLEPRFVLFNDKTLLPAIGRSNLTGQLTVFFEDSAMLDKFINETESALVATLTDSLGNEYEFNVPRLKYSGGQPDVSGQGAITLAMPFQALYDDGAESNLVITRTTAPQA